MGMNLHPKKQVTCDDMGGNFNWTGWRCLRDLLNALGCDTSEMQGSNDGGLIKSATCKKWAKAMRKGLAKKIIVSRYVKSDRYGGGGFETFKTIEEGKTPNPRQNQHELSESDVKWIETHASFFEQCGGCRQYYDFGGVDFIFDEEY